MRQDEDVITTSLSSDSNNQLDVTLPPIDVYLYEVENDRDKSQSFTGIFP